MIFKMMIEISLKNVSKTKNICNLEFLARVLSNRMKMANIMLKSTKKEVVKVKPPSSKPD